ncbi:Wzz/FepE/Etk N-terminal domain-containing protein [Phytohabitans sp. ZYX-F-186]|uniref:Wzz/FepE/Etk N-terminal domain-containing protein n=1 Tax=Phytohabitans maris TaxID=3071409 RepID=A0ABU0ZQH6_9ACTN|nr:Wzz/FepE/Etk N-terminal domain-containing protein [Phytohabitans sp. ZYX-F-186]MDQ7908687.1 Wzz/FepE/Etk N-terminal domain-containing protein [Phytohabitans sp. ZYX-F-186]
MDSSTDVSDYLGMLRRHWWVVLTLVLAGVGGAVLVTHVQPKVYKSATSVLVQPAGQDTNVVGGRTKGDINLDTEAQLVRSTAVAVGAAELLRAAPDELVHQVAVEVPANTAVLVVTFTAGDPQSAQAGSHAFAEAYLRNREESAKAELNAQITALNTKVKQLSRSLTQVNGRLADLSSSSPLRPNLESQRATMQNQLNSLSGKLNDLTTATVTGGKIISDARLPEAPIKPDPMLNLATGAMVGLLLGLGAALLRERLDRVVRAAADVTRRTRVPVLAELARGEEARLDGVLPAHGEGGRTFNRLRNEVVASLGPDDKVVVVAGASRGVASTLVAANLAAALARTGSDVVLVGAHLPDSVADAAPLASIFGVAPTPGLSDVLAGRVGLARAVQHAPRIPSLRVITNGGTASAAGLMQSQGLRDALDLLSARPGYVVIEAPATSSSADAQSLASLADAAIIAVELRRTRRPDVSDAAEQLRRVGTPLLGAVVVPRIAGVPPAPDPDPAPQRALSAAPTAVLELPADLTGEAVPAKEAAPVKEVVPVKEAIPAKEVVPAREGAPTGEATPAKEAAPAKEATTPKGRADLSSAGLSEVDLDASTAVIRLPPGLGPRR